MQARQIFGIFILFLFGLPAQSQSIRISVASDTVLFGGAALITLSIPAGQNQDFQVTWDLSNVQNKKYDGNNPVFEEFADVGSDSLENGTLEINKNMFDANGNLSVGLYFFTMGEFVLRPPDWTDASGNVHSAQDSVRIFVVAPDYLLNDTTDTIQDIKDIIEIEKTWWEKLMPFAIGLGVLVGLWLISLLFKSRKTKEIPQVEETVVEVNPLEEALLKLQAMRESKIWKEGKMEEFQDEISYVIRNFIHRNNGISALEMTTSEITSSMEKDEFLHQHTSQVRDLLSIADLVKFAKAKPEEDLYETFIDQAEAFVKKTYTDKTREAL